MKLEATAAELHKVKEQLLDGVDGVSEPRRWKIYAVMLSVMLISIFIFH
jgi:hypothetical protein